MVDLVNDERSLLGNNAIDSGVRFNEPHSMISLGNNRVLVTDSTSGRLFNVDLRNVNRELIFDNADEFNFEGIALYQANNLAYLINNTEDQLQKDLDDLMDYYNNNRTHQSKICCGRTPMETLLDGKSIWVEKNLAHL